METIERILGHEIPVLPEPFLPESELRPLTEADYQRLFEEFCAAPISTLPPEFWTETTTDKPVSITPAEETQAATPQRPRRHHLTDQEKSFTAHYGRKGLEKLFPGEKEKHDYLTVAQLAEECGISKQTVYDFIHDQKLPRKREGRTVLIDLHVKGIISFVNAYSK